MADDIEVLQAREALRLIDSAHALMAELAAKGVIRKKFTRPVSKEAQNEEIRELFELGYSRTEIGQRLGMNRETVSNRLRRMEQESRAS